LLFALPSTGKSIAANMAMMAMTTSNSINVKPSQNAPSLGRHTDLRILMAAAQGQAGRGEVEAVERARIVSSPIHVPEDFIALNLLFILFAFLFQVILASVLVSIFQCDAVERFVERCQSMLMSYS
jgi:hypothetical protein